LLIVNSNEVDQKDQRKKKGDHVLPSYCHHLLHNTTTIEEGDDIIIVTFFIAKPLKKVTIFIITIFSSKAIKEGDRSCHHLFLLCTTTIEEGDDFVATEP